MLQIYKSFSFLEGGKTSTEELEENIRATIYLSDHISLYIKDIRTTLHADVKHDGYDATLVLARSLANAALIQLLGTRADQDVLFYFRRLQVARSTLLIVQEAITAGTIHLLLWVRYTSRSLFFKGTYSHFPQR